MTAIAYRVVTLPWTPAAEDEQRFKSFGRNAQHRTGVWYAAYPDLSVQNIQRNARIREGLFAPMSREADVEAWLSLL